MSTDESKIIGPELLVSILKKADKPLTTRQLHEESRKIIPDCASANVIILNVMRIRGTIKGKRTKDRKWIWLVEEKTSEKRI